LGQRQDPRNLAWRGSVGNARTAVRISDGGPRLSR
jgi:hypothetical protein